MHICKAKISRLVYCKRVTPYCVIVPRYDAEEADSSRRQYDRTLLPSAPNRAVSSSDHAQSAYPIQQGDTTPTRLPPFPANNFALGRSLGPSFPQAHSGDSARTRAHYSWSPPATPVDPSMQGTRSSTSWSSVGATFQDASPSSPANSYYSQPQAQHPSASPGANHRELYFSHQYARTGTPGWTPRASNSPDIADRRISTAQPQGPIAPNQPSYTTPYMDDSRRGVYDSTTTRGA